MTVARVARTMMWLSVACLVSLQAAVGADAGQGIESLLKPQPPAAGDDSHLVVTLDLDQRDAICGESVFFTVRLTHTFKTPLSVASFEPTNRSVTLTLLRSDGTRLTADQMTAGERDGIYTQPPRQAQGRSLEPGRAMELRGDLLTWFGWLPAGEYKVRATYQGIFRVAQSEFQTLRLNPADIQAAAVASCGPPAAHIPISATWTHKQKDGRRVLIYQQLSPYLPRNTWHGVPTAIVREPVAAYAACLTKPDSPIGHLLWLDHQQRLSYAPADLEHGKIHPSRQIKLPCEGTPVGTAFTLPDLSLLVPYADSRHQRLVLLRLPETGAPQSYPLQLEGPLPFGPMVVRENDQTLYLAYAGQKGRSVACAKWSPKNPSQGLSEPKTFVLKAPIAWLDAYWDKTLAPQTQRSLYLGDDASPEPNVQAQRPSPRLMLWVVTRQANTLSCTALNTQDGTVNPAVRFDLPAGHALEVKQSVVTASNALALLLSDAGGRLYYASTMRKRLEPLARIANTKVTLRNDPALVAAGQNALEPWVHLRYVKNGKKFSYIRLEPENEPDPVEKARTTK
jgi:hypothetical protein